MRYVYTVALIILEILAYHFFSLSFQDIFELGDPLDEAPVLQFQLLILVFQDLVLAVGHVMLEQQAEGAVPVPVAVIVVVDECLVHSLLPGKGSAQLEMQLLGLETQSTEIKREHWGVEKTWNHRLI